ncbi:MAG: hypothetical protein IJS90_09395, partial [Clostridia bacterium]|nr:hypothetical protein [Clostridia bacterium]
MKLSTQTDALFKKFSVEKSVEMFAEAGFDALDLSMFENDSTKWIYSDGYKEKLEALRKQAESLGMFFN